MVVKRAQGKPDRKQAGLISSVHLFASRSLSPSPPLHEKWRSFVWRTKKTGILQRGELAKLNVIMLLYHPHIWTQGDLPGHLRSACCRRAVLRRSSAHQPCLRLDPERQTFSNSGSQDREGTEGKSVTLPESVCKFASVLNNVSFKQLLLNRTAPVRSSSRFLA